MKKLTVLIPMISAGPAFAAEGIPFFSLFNTDFVVLLAFLIFVGVLVYFGVPGIIGKLLDDRAEGIKAELEEAKSLREEAQALLASYERKQKEVADQSERIVAHAKEEAAEAAEAAKNNLKASIERRMAAAEEQLASAQAAAVKDVRNEAARVAVAAAAEVIAAKMTAAEGNKRIDDAIAEVEKKLH